MNKKKTRKKRKKRKKEVWYLFVRVKDGVAPSECGPKSFSVGPCIDRLGCSGSGRDSIRQSREANKRMTMNGTMEARESVCMRASVYL